MIPVIFNLNMRYKPMINEYIQFGLISKYPFEYALQIILENAIIKYVSLPAHSPEMIKSALERNALDIDIISICPRRHINEPSFIQRVVYND